MYCQVSTVFSHRLSNSFVLSTHLLLSHIRGCLLQLAREGFIFKQSVGMEFFYKFIIRTSFCYGQTSAFAIVCLSETPPPQTHYSPLPCTTVCPRGCYLTCTWARACSGPDWDVNYSQRLGVHFRCLRQVRIGGSRSEGWGSKGASAVAW